MIQKHLYFLFITSLAFFASTTQVLAQDNLDYQTLDWNDLIPAADREALLNPPSYLDQIDDSVFDIEYGDEFSAALPADDPYQQALVSQNVIPEMDGQAVRVPGFIVPLEFDDTLNVTEFFLVPYFGACIHLPPPPPNQMIYVTSTEGIQLDVLYDPFWISGVLGTDVTINTLGTSVYTMQLDEFEEYVIQ